MGTSVTGPTGCLPIRDLAMVYHLVGRILDTKHSGLFFLIPNGGLKLA